MTLFFGVLCLSVFVRPPPGWNQIPDGLLTDYGIIANPPRSDICSRSTHSLCVYQQRQPQPQQHFITMTERKSSSYDPQMELLHKVLDE